MRGRFSVIALLLPATASALHAQYPLLRHSIYRATPQVNFPIHAPQNKLRAVQPVALLPALPSISAAAIWPTAAASGAVAVAAQLGLLAKFKSSKDPSVRSIAGLLAYRIIALAYTLVLTIVGGALWFNPARWPADAAAAMLVPDGTIRWIGAVLFGELILWDLPSTFWIKKLQKPDLIIHHVGLAIGPALVAMKFLPVFYYAWYIGLSESSSVLLALNEYFASLHTAIEDVEGEESPRLPAIASKRDGFQIAAAGMFVAVRVLGWGYAVYLLFRDTLAVLPLAASLGVRSFLKLQLFMASAFYGLQLFWFSKLVAYTRSSGLGGSIPDDA